MKLSKHIFLEAERIYLRGLERKDLKGNYFQWLNDAKVCRYNSHAIFPNSEKDMEDYLEFTKGTKSAVVLAIVAKRSDVHIGNIALQRINWIDRSAEFAILMGETAYWGRGYATEAALLLVRYGFERLNLQRIYCGTSEDNKGMKKLARKLKMKPEGRRRRALFKNSRYVDVLEFGVLREEFLK